MTENLLKEAMDCGWVGMVFRAPPPPCVWEFVIDLRRRDARDDLDITLKVTVHWNKIVQQGPRGVYQAHVDLRNTSDVWNPRLIEPTIYLPPVEGFTKPEENWAKKVAEIAIKQAVAEGKLSATEHDLGDHAKKDWRKWREWHD